MAIHRAVALLATPVSLFGVGSVVEVFDLLRKEGGEHRVEFKLATTEKQPIRIEGADAGLESLAGENALRSADTLLIPGYPTDREPSASDIDVVRECHSRGARILSICTGSFLVAAAGILDGRRATTHWLYADLFKSRYPAVHLDPDILYADEGQIVTAAGSAAGLDMMLHVIRAEEGASLSNAIARRMNVSPHRDGGQAQFIPRPVPDIADDRINRLASWMRDNCTRALSIEELAAQVAMSPRNFYRHFRAVTGHTPYNWLLRERIGIAMTLLERGGLTLDRIADASGFTSADALRSHFRRVVGISPTEYRRMYARRAAPGGREPARSLGKPLLRRVA